MPAPTVTVPTNINSQGQANLLFAALVGNENAALPDIDLFDEAHSIPWDKDSPVFEQVTRLSVDELVATFKAMMGGLGAELQKEYDTGRITGAKYADTYLALTQGAMQGAVQYALGKDQAFWMAVKTQADAIASHNQNESIRLDAMLKRAQYALTKLKLAAEDSGFGQSEYQRTEVLPAQKKLLDEQMQAQRAQTLGTRVNADGTDGVAVGGLLGKQMDLYTQQKQSYMDDTKIKSAKIFSDLWVARYTINEGNQPPAMFDTNISGGDSNKAYDSIFKGIMTLAGGSLTP